MQLPTQLSAIPAPTLLARIMHAIVLISIIMVTITGLVVTSVLLGRVGSLTNEETTTRFTTISTSTSISTTLTISETTAGDSTTALGFNDIMEFSENLTGTQKSTRKNNKRQKARTTVNYLNPNAKKQADDHKTTKVKQGATKKVAFKRAHSRNVSSARDNHTSTPLFKQRTLWLEVL